MIRILIKSDNVSSRNGSGRAAGKVFRHQSGAIDNGNDFPQPCRVPLDEHQPAYPPGTYTLTPASFYAGEYGDIEVSRSYKLVRLDEKPAAKASV